MYTHSKFRLIFTDVQKYFAFILMQIWPLLSLGKKGRGGDECLHWSVISCILVIM